MKERPILFSGPMVRALLDGKKTQTRRIITPAHLYTSMPVEEVFAKMTQELRDMAVGWCRHGKPGDRLWVKETFSPAPKHEPKFAAVVADFIYRADYEYREPDRSVIAPHHWKPSIFCTRKASRITLEVTSVRVERLNKISEADAKAEGIESGRASQLCGVSFRDYSQRLRDPFEDFASPVDSYRSLWESINGAGSWDANPYVWAITFKRITP